jgi:hypothetical protein
MGGLEYVYLIDITEIYQMAGKHTIYFFMFKNIDAYEANDVFRTLSHNGFTDEF